VGLIWIRIGTSGDTATMPRRVSFTELGSYSRMNSTKSPASGAGKVSKPRLMSRSRESARSRVRVDQCVSAVREVEVPVWVCLRSNDSHVTEVGGT